MRRTVLLACVGLVYLYLPCAAAATSRSRPQTRAPPDADFVAHGADGQLYRYHRKTVGGKTRIIPNGRAHPLCKPLCKENGCHQLGGNVEYFCGGCKESSKCNPAGLPPPAAKKDARIKSYAKWSALAPNGKGWAANSTSVLMGELVKRKTAETLVSAPNKALDAAPGSMAALGKASTTSLPPGSYKRECGGCTYQALTLTCSWCNAYGEPGKHQRMSRKGPQSVKFAGTKHCPAIDADPGTGKLRCVWSKADSRAAARAFAQADAVPGELLDDLPRAGAGTHSPSSPTPVPLDARGSTVAALELLTNKRDASLPPGNYKRECGGCTSHYSSTIAYLVGGTKTLTCAWCHAYMPSRMAKRIGPQSVEGIGTAQCPRVMVDTTSGKLHCVVAADHPPLTGSRKRSKNKRLRSELADKMSMPTPSPHAIGAAPNSIAAARAGNESSAHKLPPGQYKRECTGCKWDQFVLTCANCNAYSKAGLVRKVGVQMLAGAGTARCREVSVNVQTGKLHCAASPSDQPPPGRPRMANGIDNGKPPQSAVSKFLNALSGSGGSSSAGGSLPSPRPPLPLPPGNRRR